jgi:hypothetical protein
MATLNAYSVFLDLNRRQITYADLFLGYVKQKEDGLQKEKKRMQEAIYRVKKRIFWNFSDR